MILSFKECVTKYGNQYQIENRINSGELYKIEPGIYALSPDVPEEAVLAKKYPKAVFAGDYAFYYHELTDVIPDGFTLATSGGSQKIAEADVTQLFVRQDLLYLGAAVTDIKGYKIMMYDRERMLIELLRFKHRMPYDYYKEILSNYRQIITELQIWRIQEYAAAFPKSGLISRALAEEVF